MCFKHIKYNLNVLAKLEHPYYIQYTYVPLLGIYACVVYQVFLCNTGTLWVTLSDRGEQSFDSE